MQEISVTDLLSKYSRGPNDSVAACSDEEILAKELIDRLPQADASILWSGDIEGIWFFAIIKKRSLVTIKRFSENIFQPMKVQEEVDLPVVFLVQIGGEDIEIDWEEVERLGGPMATLAHLMLILLKHETQIYEIHTPYQLTCFINLLR